MHFTKYIHGFCFKIALLSWFCVQAALGQTHIFIDYKVNACVNDEGLEGVFVNWTFDAAYSRHILKESDADNNMILNKDEQAACFNTFTKDYGKNDYFTVIKVDGKKHAVPAPTDFFARISTGNNLVSYTFFIPLKLNLSEKKQVEVQVYFFDPAIYISFTILPEDASVQNKSQRNDVSVSLKKVKNINCPTFLLKVR